MSKPQLFSIELEKHLLGGLINHPECFPDLDGFLSEKDFHSTEHQVIYSTLKQILSENSNFDKVILTHKVKGIGVKFKGDLDIGEYIEAISTFNKANCKAVVQTSKEVMKLRVLRDMYESAKETALYLDKNKNETIDKIISDVDAIHSKVIDNLSLDSSPQNIFEDMGNLIYETGNNVKEETGLKTPFESFNLNFGGLKPANVYAIASRPGQGKTTFLDWFAYKVAELNNIPVLILDTEMMTKEIQFRMAAALTEVPLWHLETGNWNKNKENRQKVEDTVNNLKKLPVYHYHVGNKNIDEICTLIRRWHWSIVGRGNPCLIVYDYLKLTGEKLAQNWAEYQAIGEKTDKLKRISEEINAPVFTAIQINRSGENFNRDGSRVQDDTTVISQSDRILWFVSFLAIFRRKTLDEIGLDGNQFGTHKLVPIKTRYQGRAAAGHQDVVERTLQDGSVQLTQNYLNFDVQNFKIEERGSLMDIVQANSLEQELNQENHSEPAFR